MSDHSVLDTEDSTSEYRVPQDRLASMCASHLLWRSSPSPAPTWLRRWKRVNWMRHLFGRIYTPSTPIRGWVQSISYRAATPVSPSATPESVLERTIRATCGREYASTIYDCVQGSFFGKTSRGISLQDLTQSSATWSAMVTRQRGEYSQRKKSGRHTGGSGSLSSAGWATPDASVMNDGESLESLESLESRRLRVKAEKKNGNGFGLPLAAQVRQWPTPAARDHKGTNSEEHTQTAKGRAHMDQLPNFMRYGPPVPQNPSTDGSRRESWATPRGSDGEKGGPNQRGSKGDLMLPSQVVQKDRQWPTPRTFMHKDSIEDRGRSNIGEAVGQTKSARLNPRWVECLQGIPIGWTMPSCAEPVTPELTNCASSEMAACHKLYQEPLVSYGTD